MICPVKKALYIKLQKEKGVYISHATIIINKVNKTTITHIDHRPY